MFSDRGKPEIVVPEGALDMKHLYKLVISEMVVMNNDTVRRAYFGPSTGIREDRCARAIRLLFVDAFLRGKYDDLVNDFTRRLLLR